MISSNSWLLKSWHICWTYLTWNEKSIIFISNRSNFTSYQGRDYIIIFNFLHWYDPYDCLWGPPLKTAETSLAPSSNITIIMIIIIIISSSSYIIIIMIILWLYIIIFTVEGWSQTSFTRHHMYRRRVEWRSQHHLGYVAGYTCSCSEFLGEAEVSFLCESLPPECRLL